MSRIRRPNFRRPFGTKGARRPVSWFDGSTTGMGTLPESSDCQEVTKAYTCGKHVFAILQKVDIEHLDRDEVLVERVIGTIVTNVAPLDNAIGGFDPNWTAVRYGMLVVEEVEDLSTWPIPDLRDPEDLKDYEWMWLHMSTPYQMEAWTTQGSAPNLSSYVSASLTRHAVNFDIRVKRKIGKSDSLVMVRHFGVPSSAPEIGGNTHFETRMIRVLTKN